MQTQTADKLKAEYESKLAKLETENQILESLPIKPDRIFHYKLYGRNGTITFGNEYGYNAKRVTLLELANLLETLPPLAMVKVKGTFTQFLGEAYYDSGAHKDKRETDISETIFPVTLETESTSGFTLKAEWIANINGEVWEINAILDNPHKLANVSSRRIEYRGGYRYEPATLQINTALNPTDGYWNCVRWSAGSDQYVNKFTAYHCQFDENPVAWAKKAFNPMTETQFEPALQG